MPEVLRLKGWMRLRQGRFEEAETELRGAIASAREQCAKSWELRSAATLAALLVRTGRRDEARDLLTPVDKVIGHSVHERLPPHAQWPALHYDLPELQLPAGGPEAALGELAECVEALLARRKFVIMLGGEHSIAAPAVLAHARRLGSRSLSVLQLDAHADLRAEDQGTPYAHACTMYRVHEHVHLVPVGIRSLSREERDRLHTGHIQPIYGHELENHTWIDRAVGALGPDVYVTIDVDYFDPAVVPATGTPEPGGGTWHPTIQLLERVFRERHVVGCDVVELAPIPGLVHPNVLAAKLVYKLIGFHAAAREHHTEPQSLG